MEAANFPNNITCAFCFKNPFPKPGKTEGSFHEEEGSDKRGLHRNCRVENRKPLLMNVETEAKRRGGVGQRLLRPYIRGENPGLV